MIQISLFVAKVEDRLNRLILRLKQNNYAKIKQRLPLILIGGYFYGMFVNSIILGIDSTFPPEGAVPIKSIWVFNPFYNYAAIFTPTGFAVTFFCTLMTCLTTKKGYSWFSGYKFKRDERGFDILPDGTHGTSHWMEKLEMSAILDFGKACDLDGTIVGKIKEHPNDSDEFAEYLSPNDTSRLNRHIIVYGASGTGKSYGFVKPFMLQAAKRKESLIVVDPKGELFESTSEYYKKLGYTVRAYNLLDMENSDGFNCLSAIEDDPSLVQTIADVIIKNTSNANERQDFWEKAELNLLTALIHYVQRKCDVSTGKLLPTEKRSLGTIYEILSTKNFAEIEEIFSQLPKHHPALAPYGIFKLANRQIWGNIAIGLGNRLSVFQNELVNKITKYDDIDLTLAGITPCVYYCIISAQDSSLEFLSSMFFSLLFTRLPNYARKNFPNAKLPIPVNVMLEEMCNVGYLADFKKTISVCRSFNINCQMIIQGVAQLSERYRGREWEEIIGNADTQIFLGCNDEMTAEYISKKCGMATIRTTTATIPMQPLFSPIYNSSKPYSQGRSNNQRPLMYADELLRLDNSQAIVLIRGQNPLMLYKITPEELPQFSELIPARVVDYIPSWRTTEQEVRERRAERKKVKQSTEQISFDSLQKDEEITIPNEIPPTITADDSVIVPHSRTISVTVDEIINHTKTS